MDFVPQAMLPPVLTESKGATFLILKIHSIRRFIFRELLYLFRLAIPEFCGNILLECNWSWPADPFHNQRKVAGSPLFQAGGSTEQPDAARKGRVFFCASWAFLWPLNPVNPAPLRHLTFSWKLRTENYSILSPLTTFSSFILFFSSLGGYNYT